MTGKPVSKQTQKNWWIDASLALTAVIAALSGIYFLYLPSGGYMGGRNSLYNVTVLFSRHTWDQIHLWGGLAMILAATVHLAIHWTYVVNMTRRTWKELTGQCACMNPRGRWNLAMNAFVAISFAVTSLSGVYLLFVPGGRDAIDPMIMFSRTTWDLVHTWAGVILVVVAVIHFAIHWKWVTKVTRKVFQSLFSRRVAAQPVPVENLSS